MDVKSSTKLSEVNVKDTFTSHIDKKNIFDIFVDTLSLYMFCSSIVINTVIVTAGNFEP
jgi:hypothetical protein